MRDLPHPTTQKQIREMLTQIDERLLDCSESFVRLQVKKPLLSLLQSKVPSYDLNSPKSEWLNICSIYNANQQLNEACNKLWATIELANATHPKNWKKSYLPIGEEFGGPFLLGTLLPTLYYSQLSAIISILSAFGCMPLLIRRKPYFLIRTQSGWRIFSRGIYVEKVLGARARSWHDQILRTYQGLAQKGVSLPKVDIERTFKLKKLRNEMHYEILGDLRMWRMLRNTVAYFKYLDLVTSTVKTAIMNLKNTKKVTTGCDRRFENLEKNVAARLL